MGTDWRAGEVRFLGLPGRVAFPFVSYCCLAAGLAAGALIFTGAWVRVAARLIAAARFVAWLLGSFRATRPGQD